MGATHHALEDYGVLLTLPGMTVYAPAFDEDVVPVVASAGASDAPCYIRLGRGEPPAGAQPPAYAPWRCLLPGACGIMVAVGPLAGSAWDALGDMPAESRPALWAMCELRAGAHPPEELVRALRRKPQLAVVEEHVAHGGAGSMLCLWAASAGIVLEKFVHLHASNAPRQTYGSQQFMRRQAGLDPASIEAAATSFATVAA
jgi:transketolase